MVLANNFFGKLVSNYFNGFEISVIFLRIFDSRMQKKKKKMLGSLSTRVMSILFFARNGLNN